MRPCWLIIGISDDPAEFAESLQRMFEGHDVIAESAEGQAFRASATVIARPSQRSQLETDIAEITERVEGLPKDLSEALGGFIDAMWRRVQDVEGVRAAAFRRISNFVRGGDALHYRSMRTRISEAQAAAAEAFQRIHCSRDIGFAVPMSGGQNWQGGVAQMRNLLATMLEEIELFGRTTRVTAKAESERPDVGKGKGIRCSRPRPRDERDRCTVHSKTEARANNSTRATQRPRNDN